MIKFLKEFIKNPKDVGAIMPSSSQLAEGIINEIDFNVCKCIVELGAGTGIFTEKIISRKKENTILLVFEKNKHFCNYIKAKYKYQKNVKIIYDSAENIKKYLNIYKIERVDFIISGLPFTSLPNEISHNILFCIKEIMHEYSKFIFFQYSLIKKHLFYKYFDSISITKIFFNMPPAFIFKMKRKEENFRKEIF